MNVALALVALVPFAFVARSLQSTPPAAPAPSAPEQRVDPTAIDAELLRALAERDGSTTATRTAAIAPFPAVSIRGLVVPQSGGALAILDVGGTRVRVRAGTIIPLGGGEDLRVEDIGAGEVVLSRASTGETRSVR